MVSAPRFKLSEAIAVFALIVVAGCGNSNGPEGKIIARIGGPEGGVTAIISKVDGGATVSTGYRVYLQATNSKTAVSEVLRMDKGAAPRVAWTGNGIRIDVPCGQIYKFTNFAVLTVAGQIQKMPVTLVNRGLCP